MATILLATLDRSTGRAVLDACVRTPVTLPAGTGVENHVLAAATFGSPENDLVTWRDRLLAQGWRVLVRYRNPKTGEPAERDYQPRGRRRRRAETQPDAAPPPAPWEPRPPRHHPVYPKICVTCGKTGKVLGRHLKATGHERWEYIPDEDQTDTPEATG